MQLNEARCRISFAERKEKVEAVLARLQSLKSQMSELRVECEALKKLQLEKQEGLMCNECGKLIEEGQEVMLKDFYGKVKRHYHKDCFKAIWISQTWKFDYSSPGFLRMWSKSQ